MNNMDDLHHEFDRRADQATDHDAVRRTVTDRSHRKTSRRRNIAWIAAAAAVVLIAGGVTATRAVMSQPNGTHPASPAPSGTRTTSSAPTTTHASSPGPSGNPGVVPVPTVPLPTNTQLIRFQLKPVTSPVSATPPKGLTGPGWGDAGQHVLTVAFEPGDGSYGSEAGYVISDKKQTPQRRALESEAAKGLIPGVAPMSTRHVTAGGHDAILKAPTDEPAPGGGAVPSGDLLVWQLSNGQWIHVWVDGGSTRDFAASIHEDPTTLDRTIGIGLTLPGFTHTASSNPSPITTIIGGRLHLCPAPQDSQAGSSASSGSGSNSAPASGTASLGSAASGAVSTAAGSGSSFPQRLSALVRSFTTMQTRCLGVIVFNGTQASDLLSDKLAGQPVTVGQTAVTVDAASQAARADLGRGLHAVVRAPDSVHLSKQDLAALAASVRVSPDVTVQPPN